MPCAHAQHAATHFETIRQAHHFDDPTSASSIAFFTMSGIVGVADLTLIVANSISLVTKKNIPMWGGLGIAASAVTILGLTPLYIEEGGGWFLAPLIPGAALLTLSIINLALRPKTSPPTPTQRSVPPSTSQLLWQ